MNKYYVYGHYRADTGEIFYVGKGKNRRAWAKDNRNRHWHHVVSKCEYHVKLLYENLTHNAANKLETELIKHHGRRDCGTGILVNMSDGGDGLRGHSLETKKKMSSSAMGNTSWLGGHHTKSSCQKIRDGLLGHSCLPKTRTKIANSKAFHWGPIIAPTGILYSSIWNLREFCRTHSLDHAHMRQVYNGLAKQHKGWHLPINADVII